MTDRKPLIAVESRPLPNGSVLYVLPHSLSPLVLIQAVVRTGSIHEAEFTGCGISHFLEHMLFQGCERYPGNSASDRIHALGCEAGISIKPKTPVEVLFPILKDLDLVLVMTVEPGFGGQKLIPGSTDRIRKLRAEAEKVNPSLKIEVDGGVKLDNVKEILDDFRALGGSAVTVEPHLSVFDGLRNLEQAGQRTEMGAYTYPSGDAAFDAACGALKRLL